MEKKMKNENENENMLGLNTKNMMKWLNCYELKSLESDNRTTLVLSNTRELDRELFYKLVYLI